jgi:hypothetical protein
MKRIVTFLMTTLVATGATAQVVSQGDLAEAEPLRRYTVEVIVFSYTEDVSVGSEIFLPDAPPPAEEMLLNGDGNAVDPDAESVPVFADTSVDEEIVGDDEELGEEPLTWMIVPDADAITVDDSATSRLPVDTERPNPFRLALLTEDEYSLRDALRKFELLDAYETLAHFGWTQPAFPEEETPAIELSLLTEPVNNLDGTFTLYLSRYLHLVVDLALDAPSEFEEEVIDDDSFFSFGDAQRQYGEESERLPVRFRIQEDRIFKNGDLRYFDHPRFGILAKVTRVEEAEENDADSDGEAGTLARSD